jgi:hypothetical protein
MSGSGLPDAPSRSSIEEAIAAALHAQLPRAIDSALRRQLIAPLVERISDLENLIIGHLRASDGATRLCQKCRCRSSVAEEYFCPKNSYYSTTATTGPSTEPCTWTGPVCEGQEDEESRDETGIIGGTRLRGRKSTSQLFGTSTAALKDAGSQGDAPVKLQTLG